MFYLCPSTPIFLFMQTRGINDNRCTLETLYSMEPAVIDAYNNWFENFAYFRNGQVFNSLILFNITQSSAVFSSSCLLPFLLSIFFNSLAFFSLILLVLSFFLDDFRSFSPLILLLPIIVSLFVYSYS